MHLIICQPVPGKRFNSMTLRVLEFGIWNFGVGIFTGRLFFFRTPYTEYY